MSISIFDFDFVVELVVVVISKGKITSIKRLFSYLQYLIVKLDELIILEYLLSIN
jgi:hypothetical protein